MTWLDAILLVFLLFGLIRGAMRGLITEVFATFSVVIAAIGAGIYKGELMALLQRNTSWSVDICRILSAVFIFIGLLIALSLISKIIKKFLHSIKLGGIDRLLGALFGTLKWGIVVLCCVWCINQVDIHFHFMDKELVLSSHLYPKALDLSNQVFTYLSNK